MNQTRASRTGTVVSYLCILFVVALIWGKEISAFWVWPTTVDNNILSQAVQRPSRKTLEEISAQRLGLPVIRPQFAGSRDASIIDQANLLLSGTAEFHKKTPINLSVPFTKDNLIVGTSSHQLHVAGLSTVEILLNAYRVSRDEKFLRAAQVEMEAFSRIDAAAFIPIGFLWNDHALANSISILAELWLYVREAKHLDPRFGKELLSFAARVAERTSNPQFFTYRTNHGIMQSVALLQYASAFPSLHNSERLARLGCSRLSAQLKYYVSPEGPILEHSAGYHELGLDLLTMSVELADRNQCAVPDEWQKKLRHAQSFSAMLRRPDGSLPVFGNTDSGERVTDKADGVPKRPEQPVSWLPLSGYAIWWNGLESWPVESQLAQTVVAWSNFPTKAHKHADDMSVLIRAQGHQWITNVGYWPYDARGYAAAQGWGGANAPHFADESPSAFPPARLRGFTEVARLRAIELDRFTASGNSTLRRQIVEIDGSSWLVADTVTGNRIGHVERLWTTSPEIETTVASDGRVVMMRPNGTEASARLSFLGDIEGRPGIHRGELEPFAGWLVKDGHTTPATAISLAQPGQQSLVLSILEVGEARTVQALSLPTLEEGSTPDAWRVKLQTKSGPLTVSWTRGLVSAQFRDGTVTASMRKPDEALTSARAEIASAYLSMTQRFTRFRDLTAYRYKLTALVVMLALLQEGLLFSIRRWTTFPVLRLRMLASAVWLSFGLFCTFVFLK